MTITLASLHSEIRLAFVNRGDVETLIDQWANSSQRALASRLRVRELDAAATMTFAPTDTAGIYLTPGDMWAPILWINTSKRRMEIRQKPLETIQIQPLTPTGDPDKYCVRGNTFIIRPLAKDADITELTYKSIVPTMTSLVDAVLPEEFRPAIVFDAIARGLHILQQEDRAKMFEQRADKELMLVGDQRGEEVMARAEGVFVQTGVNDAGKTIWPRG